MNWLFQQTPDGATYLQVIIVVLLAAFVVLPLAWHTIRDSFCIMSQQKGVSLMYHEINEAAAKRAHDANSHYEFKPGKATAEYRSQVDNASDRAEVAKRATDPMYHEKIDYYLELYSKKLAEWYNRHFEIEARVPSWLVSGGGNFPVRQKHSCKP